MPPVQEDSPVVFASDFLIAVLVNIKKASAGRQLFIDLDYNGFQELWDIIVRDYRFSYLKKLFVFSDSGPIPFCPILQEALEHLQLAGILCWPDRQEPNIMRLNPSAELYYENDLTSTGSNRLPLQDIQTSQEIARALVRRCPPFDSGPSASY